MTNQYQIQQFDSFGKTFTLSTDFERLEVVKKNNTVGAATISLAGVQLIGVGYEVLENITFSIDWTQYKNSVFVGGQGEGEDRLIVTVDDELGIGRSLWGRSEIFEASRDSDSVDALATVGRNFIGSKREITTFNGNIIDQPNFIFNENYFFGDVLNFSQPNINAIYNTPFIIQRLNNKGLGIVNNSIYFLKQINVDNDSLRTELILNDALCLLDQRIVAYALGTTQTTKEGHADDLIKEICRENLLADGREIPNLTIDRDLSNAPIVKVDDIAWRSVLSVCQEIAQASFEKGTPLYFDLIADINLGLTLKTFVGQRGNDRAGVVGVNSPYRAMINAVTLRIGGGREDVEVEFLQLNGEELKQKTANIVVSSNEAEIQSRSGRSGGVDPFEYALLDSEGELIIDSEGVQIVDSEG